MQIQLLRNATLLVSASNKTILVDPMLAPKFSYDPFSGTDNTIRNPTIDLPIDEKRVFDLLNATDMLLLTHLHPDHFDHFTQERISRTTMICCQPADENALRNMQFQKVRPIEDEITWEGMIIRRTRGQHGTGEIGLKMGAVSGYLLVEGDIRVTFWGTPFGAKR